MINLHPAVPFFVAAVLITLLNRRLTQVVQLLTPVVSFLYVLRLKTNPDSDLPFVLFGYSFDFFRIDGLSLLFVYAFLLFCFLCHLYALHSTNKYVHVAANVYVGSALGAVLAGDLVTLFVFWEIMAVSSTFLIWNRLRPRSLYAAFRYLLVHLTGGLFFLTGILLKMQAGESLTFHLLTFDTAGWFIFAGFAVNAAIPPIHPWLPDAYPEGTPSASNYLSAFTTKVAVYAFARAFAGAEILIWLGVLQAVYGVIYALLENDIRRLLSYHIICQIGYMLCGIGLGSAIGIDAGTGHAVGNILFKGLLFMATGTIIYMTGYSKLSDLGGLAKNHRLTLLAYMIGALAISGMPLLNGYVTKTLLLKAAETAHLYWLEVVLLFVAAGTFLSITCKLAYFAFWGERHAASMINVVPWNMRLAMTGTALVCIITGIFPNLLYAFLPSGNTYQIFGLDHVIHTLELLIGTLLGFLLILRFLHTKAAITLDTDWLYRKGANFFVATTCVPIKRLQETIQDGWSALIENLYERLKTVFPNRVVTDTYHALALIVVASFAVAVFLLSRYFG